MIVHSDTKPLIIGLDPYFEIVSSVSTQFERELKFMFWLPRGISGFWCYYIFPC